MGSRGRRLLLIGGTATVIAIVVAVMVISRSDGATDFSEPQQIVDRLEAAGIGGCRVEDDRTAGCFDVAGVAYFRVSVLDDEMSFDDTVTEACDESTITVLVVEGQNWLGRVRAFPERAADLAAALGSTPVPCDESLAP